jgi:hypothetical protein
MVLKRGEPRDGLAPDLEGRDTVGDPLVGLGQDLQDRLPQLGQRGALRLLQSIQILVDLLSGHRSIVLIDQPQQQAAPHRQPVLCGRWLLSGYSTVQRPIRRMPSGGCGPITAWRDASDAMFWGWDTAAGPFDVLIGSWWTSRVCQRLCADGCTPGQWPWLTGLVMM